jgi:hypothetical protein
VVARSQVQVYVAALPASVSDRAGGDAALVDAIGEALADESAVVLLITDAPSVYADNSSALGARGVNAGVAVRSVQRGSFDEAGIRDFLQQFVQNIDAQASGGTVGGAARAAARGAAPGCPCSCSAAWASGRTPSCAAQRSKQNAQPRGRARRRRVAVRPARQRRAAARPGDDAIARQALADAAERYNATGALMAKADTLGEFAAARRTAVEGLAAARWCAAARPRPRARGPAAARLRPAARGADGRAGRRGAVRGLAAVRAGRPHYYEGGYYGSQHVPGGWYATPFWQTLLLTSVLNSGRGLRRGYGRRRYYARGGYSGGGC